MADPSPDDDRDRETEQVDVHDAVRRQFEALEREPVDELQMKRIADPGWSRGIPLPVKDRDLATYQIRYRTAMAIVVPDAEAQHWRIPYIVRWTPGDMKQLLDRFVDEVGTGDIKFVNVSPTGALAALADVAGFPDPRELRDAVHGFEETTELWEGPMGTDVDEVDCLVGTWEPGAYEDGDE